MATKQTAYFIMLINGEINYAEFPSIDNLYCKYSYVSGADWKQISGTAEGVSGQCKRRLQSNQITIGLPLNATFTSTNPFGWPQILISCYGMNSFGNDVVRGYGAIHLPTVPGRKVQKISMCIPESSTAVQKCWSWITGKNPEFIEPQIVASGQGRYVTRVRCQGFIHLMLNVVFKNTKKHGYDLQASTVLRDAFYPDLETTRNENTNSSKHQAQKVSTPKSYTDQTLAKPDKAEHDKELVNQPSTSRSDTLVRGNGDKKLGQLRPLPVPKPRMNSRKINEIDETEEI